MNTNAMHLVLHYSEIYWIQFNYAAKRKQHALYVA